MPVCLHQQRPDRIRSGHRLQTVAIDSGVAASILDSSDQSVHIGLPGLIASRLAAVND